MLFLLSHIFICHKTRKGWGIRHFIQEIFQLFICCVFTNPKHVNSIQIHFWTLHVDSFNDKPKTVHLSLTTHILLIFSISCFTFIVISHVITSITQDNKPQGKMSTHSQIHLHYKTKCKVHFMCMCVTLNCCICVPTIFKVAIKRAVMLLLFQYAKTISERVKWYSPVFCVWKGNEKSCKRFEQRG